MTHHINKHTGGSLTPNQTNDSTPAEEAERQRQNYHMGHAFTVDLAQMDAKDISYLIDLLVEELAYRIDSLKGGLECLTP